MINICKYELLTVKKLFYPQFQCVLAVDMCEGQPETDPMLSALGEYAGGPGQMRKPAGKISYNAHMPRKIYHVLVSS